MTVRTLLQIALVNMPTIVTYSIGDVECKVVTTFLGSHLQQMQILLFRQVFVKVHMEGRTTCQMLDVWRTMEFELIDDGKRIVLYHIEIAVITIAWYKIAILTIPLGMFHTYILGRNHFTVKHHILGTILTVVFLNESENTLDKMQIVIIRRYFQSHKLGSLNQAVDTDGEILTTNINVARVEERQHAMLL